MQKETSDEELMLLIQQGSEVAFEALYLKYADQLVGFAASKLKAVEEARDIIHDLFIHFWEQRNEIVVRSSLKGFLFASVRYRIIDHIRKSAVRQKYVHHLTTLPQVTPAPETELEGKEMEKKIRAIANELSPRVKEVFVLSRFQHLSPSEIAKKIGNSERTVKNQLTTALSYIRSRLFPLLALIMLLKKLL